MVRVFLILGMKPPTLFSPINNFGRKNLHSPQAQTILSDIFKISSDVFKIPSDVFKIPSDEKEISWEVFVEMSHKIVRMSRHFIASKHKQPQNEPFSCDFIKKLRFSKARRIVYFRPVFLSLEFSC